MTRPGILLIRLKSMGDIVFTLPAVRSLRRARPSARITYLVSREYGPLVKGFAEVDEVLELDRRKYKGLHPLKMMSETLRVIKQVRQARPGLAIDFQGYGETGLLTWASSAPQRWGTVYRQSRKWAYTHAVARQVELHPAADCLALLEQNGIPAGTVKNEFCLPEQGKIEAEAFVREQQIPADRPILFIQALTSSRQKNWPLDNYVRVAAQWRSQGWEVIFGGGPEDRVALEKAEAAGFIVAAGVSLLASAGLVARSALVLGGDTGLVHLGVALGKRVVMVMRSAHPGSTHPFGHANWAVCSAAGSAIDSIPVEAVLQQCRQACFELAIPATYSAAPSA